MIMYDLKMYVLHMTHVWLMVGSCSHLSEIATP